MMQYGFPPYNHTFPFVVQSNAVQSAFKRRDRIINGFSSDVLVQSSLIHAWRRWVSDVGFLIINGLPIDQYSVILISVRPSICLGKYICCRHCSPQQDTCTVPAGFGCWVSDYQWFAY